jgi:hypothetical protein
LSCGSERIMPGPDAKRLAYERALLSEIRMLLDYIAAQPDKSLADLGIRDPDHPKAELGFGDILARLGVIERQVNETDARPLAPNDAALMILLRDSLVRKTNPATGLTIAYTAMVSCSGRGDGSESRATMAQAAYAGLIGAATVHRVMQQIWLCLALLVAAAAVWESAKVSLGRSLLQNLEGLRTQQAHMEMEKAKLETSLAPLSEGRLTVDALLDNRKRVVLAAFAACDHPDVIAYYLRQAAAAPETAHEPTAWRQPGAEPVARVASLAMLDGANPTAVGDPLDGKWRIYDTPQARDVCERDRVLAINFSIVQNDLRLYRTDWPSIAGSAFRAIAHVVRGIAKLGLLGGSHAQSAQDSGQSPDQKDVELLVAPVLVVWSNYVLPLLFGCLGSLMFVILDFYRKIRTSRLDPRDTRLGPIRLVLGVVAGTCIGLFFSAAGPSTPGDAATIVASLTLSASGLALLAGFGVESVFNMLDALARRMFAGETTAK